MNPTTQTTRSRTEAAESSSAAGTSSAASTPALLSWLPTDITRGTYVLALLSLLTEMGIVVTGGAVRLTASGLGCPTWPLCTPESLTNTPEMGIHGVIEFGNRTLTGVLSIVALLMILWLWRIRRSHREIFWMSVGLLGGIVVQAVLGGITVLTQLNPWIVAAHFLISGIMIFVAALMFQRVRLQYLHGAEAALVDGPTTSGSRLVAWVAFIALWFSVVLGTMVTGTGPHSGDAEAVRHGFNAELITRLHVVPVYVLVAAALILLVSVLRRPATSAAQRRSTLWLLAVIILQGAIGYYQHFNGLPVLAVALHMLGSTASIVAVTVAWQRQVSRYQTRPAVAAAI